MHHKLPKDIHDILDIARLAPSSHNTQPWTVRVDGHKLTIGYDSGRHLAVGDPGKRELFISLGCFIEAVATAAPCYGYKATVHYLGNKAGGVARVSLSKLKAKSGPRALDLLRHRRSDRRHYQDKKIPTDIIGKLGNITRGSASLSITDSPEAIGFLSEMTAEATREIMSDPAFREELAGWVRHNWTRQPDGMPGYTQGIPGPVSLFAKVVIRNNKRMANSQAKQDSRRVARSSAIGLVCIPKDDPPCQLDAGRVYQRACLAGAKYGLKTAGVSAAIVNDDTSEQIAKRLALKGKPVALIRFGYTKSVPKTSPRLSLSDFVVNS